MSQVLFTFIGAALLTTVLSMPAQAQQRPQIETTKVDATVPKAPFGRGYSAPTI